MTTNPDASLPSEPDSDGPLFQRLILAFQAGQWDRWKLETDGAQGTSENSIDAALKSSEQFDELLGAMFPDGVSAAPEFCAQLDVLGNAIELDHARDKVVGRVWSAALERVALTIREAILNSFAERQLHDLFGLFGALEIVLHDHEFRPEFAAAFFSTVAERIARDGAQGAFWTAAKTYCEHHAAAALATLPHLIQKPSEARLGVASFIMGTLRKLPLSESEGKSFDEFQAVCVAHSTSQLRAVVIRSWATTSWQMGITLSEFQSLISTFEGRILEDRDCLIETVCRIVPIVTLPDEVSDAGIDWLSGVVSNLLSSPAKYAIVEMLVRLAQSGQRPGAVACERISKLLFAIQPIPIEDRGTWHEVERYCVALLDRDINEFKGDFLRFAQNDPIGLNTVVKQPKSFDWLLNKMSEHDVAELIGQLIVSPAAKSRQLGLSLFDRLDVQVIPAAVLDAAGEKGARVAFFELQRVLSSGEFISGEAAARVIASLLPGVASMDDELKADFRQEVFLQSCNLAMGFRGELEKRAPNSPLVKPVLERHSRYHQELKRAHESGISSIGVPGFTRAIKLYQRRFSKQMADSVKEHSTILQLVKHVSLLYGSASGSYFDGELTDPRPLAQISHSMELPMVAFSDPEGMTLRRWQIGQAISDLMGEASVDELPEAS